MKAYEDQQFDIVDRDDDFLPVYKEFTGNDEIDQKMANYALRRMDTDFQQALDEGKSFAKAAAYSRFNLTRPQMMMPVEFEVPGRIFGTNTTEIPMIVVENLKDLPEDSQRLRILEGFGFDMEEAQAIVAQLKKVTDSQCRVTTVALFGPLVLIRLKMPPPLTTPNRMFPPTQLAVGGATTL